MTDHVFVWDSATTRHTCRECGRTKPHATPEEYRAFSDAHDTANAMSENGVSESVTATGYPIYSLNVSTPQGYARVTYAFHSDDAHEIIGTRFQVNMRDVDSIPASFRKFHVLHSPALIDAMRTMFRARVAIVLSEAVAPCPVSERN